MKTPVGGSNSELEITGETPEVRSDKRRKGRKKRKRRNRIEDTEEIVEIEEMEEIRSRVAHFYYKSSCWS